VYKRQHGFFTEKHQVGQTVVMRIQENHLLHTSVRLYLLPLLLLLLPLSIGYVIFKAVGWSADLGGLLGFLAGLSWLMYGRRKTTRPEVTFLAD